MILMVRLDSNNTQANIDLFKISHAQNQKIGGIHVVQERRAADFEAPKLRKGRSVKTRIIYLLEHVLVCSFPRSSRECMRRLHCVTS